MATQMSKQAAQVTDNSMSTTVSIRVLDDGYSYHASTRSNKFVRGFGLADNRALYNWVKTQPHTVVIAADGSGKAGAMGSVSDSFGEIIQPDFDMKIQVHYTGTGSIYGSNPAEYSVSRITYGTSTSSLGNGTNLTLTQEHRFYHPSNLVFDETLDFNPADTGVIPYSEFSELKGNVTTADFVLDDGTTYEFNSTTLGFGNGVKPSYLGGSWAFNGFVGYCSIYWS